MIQYTVFVFSAGGRLLEATGASQNSHVIETEGMCDDRPSTGPDIAYKIKQEAILTVPTADLFPGRTYKKKIFFSNKGIKGYFPKILGYTAYTA